MGMKNVCAYAALILLLMAIFPKVGHLIIGAGFLMAVVLVLVLVVIGALLIKYLVMVVENW